MAAPVILVEAAPRHAADGATVSVRLAGGGANRPYHYGGEHWRAGIAGLPRSVSALDFDGEQLGGGGIAQALELRWAPGTNAALSDLASLYWTDAPVTVRIGAEGGTIPPIAATGLVLDAAADSGVLRIALADKAADLKRALLVDRYAGTGGLEGPVEWEGRIKSRAWGRCFNVPGQPLDKANNIWCFGDPLRAWSAFDQVRDMGVAAEEATLPVLGWQGSAAATLTALRATAAPQGGGVRCPSIASVKWWTEPAGDLRADVRGEIAGGYVETAAGIAARIVAARSPLAFVSGSVAAAAAARPAPFGWRVDSDSSTAAAELSALLAGVSLSWLIEGDAFAFRPWDWTPPVRVARSHGVTRRRLFKPVATRKLGYRRNWSPMARGDLAAIVFARDVIYEDGRSIVDVIAEVGGVPGPTGANGLTSYLHVAYSDSPDGVQNFTTGAPEGRMYRGEYSDFTAADSGDAAVYTWSRYVGPAAFGLAISGPGYLRGNSVHKDGTSGLWDFQAYSTEGWRGGAQATFRGRNPFGSIMAGLNSDPVTNAGFDTIDFAWYLTGGGVGSNGSQVWANGVALGQSGGRWNESTTFQVVYDNRNVRWLKDGALVAEAPVAGNLLLYFDSSVLEPNVGIKDIAFGATGSAGSDGAPGLNGSDGAPGASGADGLTSYVHTAFADSLDGVVNFTTGTPDGRGFRGEYSDFSAADSNDPAVYVWSEYRGPAAFGLAITGPGYLRGSMAAKTGAANAYDFQVYSTEGWRGGCQATFRSTNHFGDAHAGLNSDPTTDTDFASIDYAWRLIGAALGSNQCVATMNGVDTPFVGGAWNSDTTFQVLYDNRRVRWMKDGGEVYSVAATPGLLLYFAGVLHQPNVGLKDIAFGAAGAAGADGAPGLNGTNGIQGPPGAGGVSTYTHLAFANSPDGSVDFVTGEPGGRFYVGIYRDTIPADSGDYHAYSWSRWRGADGTNGIPGAPGSDGVTPFFHTAYANSADGTVDFSQSPVGRTYLGTYSDTTEADSGNPAAYTWALIKGADGSNGVDGSDGVSPISVSAQPEAIQVNTDASGAPLNLPQSIANTTTQAGSVIAATVTIVSTAGVTATVSGSTITITAVAGGIDGEVVYTVAAAGQTVSKRVGVTIVRSGADGAVQQNLGITTPQLSWSSYQQHGGTVAINASATGKLDVNLTGVIRTALGGYLQFSSKIQYRAAGGTWIDLAGSEKLSTVSEQVFEPTRQLNANVNGSGPYAMTGLASEGAYELRVLTYKTTGSDNSAFVNMTLSGRQVV